MMKKIIFISLFLSLLIAQDTEGKEKEVYTFDTQHINQLEVKIDYSVGEFTISDNENSELIEGSIEYFPEWVSPDIRYHSVGKKGKLKIEMESIDRKYGERGYNIRVGKNIWKGLYGNDYMSSASFRLPRNIPTEIEMEFGLSSSHIDMSHLSITNLDLESGLGETTLIMDSPNPETIKKVSISTGLGDFVGKKLGNLRAREYEIEIGMGSSTIDFTGDITDDIEGTIDVGLGSCDLVFPKNANVRLEIDHSFLSSIDVRDLVQKDGVWISPQWTNALPTIEFHISVGLGSVDVHLE